MADETIARDPTDDDFNRDWEVLESEGACDGLGGCEYRRVFSQWCAAGRPIAIPFIRTHANEGPGGVQGLVAPGPGVARECTCCASETEDWHLAHYDGDQESEVFCGFCYTSVPPIRLQSPLDRTIWAAAGRVANWLAARLGGPAVAHSASCSCVRNKAAK